MSNLDRATTKTRRQPSQAAGREVKLNYATQVSVQPPTFAIFDTSLVNRPPVEGRREKAAATAFGGRLWAISHGSRGLPTALL